LTDQLCETNFILCRRAVSRARAAHGRNHLAPRVAQISAPQEFTVGVRVALDIIDAAPAPRAINRGTPPTARHAPGLLTRREFS
jgi:hypothetical protein